MLRRLYQWVIALAERPSATWALAGVSAAESSFFPVPPDIMLVPMCIARPDRAWWYAFICTVASVLGGLVGYAIGALLYETVGMFLIQLYGYGDKVDAFAKAYAEYGHWIILIKGLTPIPYKVVTITSGFAHYSLFWFVVLSIITRGARFFLVAGLLYWIGPPARVFIEERLGLVTFVFAVVVVGGFIAALYLF
ncbi:YqaA family protein [Ancylobacter defluvii]|uniref:Cytochrome b561 n=1 Tax=Ancylobacter defluvii TaxID=1282440 RepID=A0A9W6N9G2_9HYPH|nr:YqaA family protein [Ancylobacter defluvii]MBS7586194.1 DedA family protein [Ancylobacter defluvii]GLK82392.1 cytochrome b561 [Ancylobacter defluvii]